MTLSLIFCNVLFKIIFFVGRSPGNSRTRSLVNVSIVEVWNIKPTSRRRGAVWPTHRNGSGQIIMAKIIRAEDNRHFWEGYIIVFLLGRGWGVAGNSIWWFAGKSIIVLFYFTNYAKNGMLLQVAKLFAKTMYSHIRKHTLGRWDVEDTMGVSMLVALKRPKRLFLISLFH